MSSADISSKTCFKCGISKPRTEFYKHPAMGDGLLGKCKECAKRDANEHRANNLDKIREYDKRRALLPHRKKLADEITRIWRAADNRRGKCHRAVWRAVCAGHLVREHCSVCGAKKSLAHHESYDRPLDVVWYCQVHHKARHKEMAIEGIEP
jgi:hypothetical protein